MSKAAEKTGSGPIASVAIEQFFPKEQRIIQDDLAYRILPFAVRSFLRIIKWKPLRDWIISSSEKNIPGAWMCILGRKRYIDEMLEAVAGEIDAIVNLGAGFDTRAYRLPSLKNLPVWEVDLPANVGAKQKQLRNIFGDVPSNVKLVSMDFDNESLEVVLKEHGFSPEMKTFFIMEGVTQYLTQDGIGATFDFLSKASCGSKLAFTYVLKEFIDGKKMYGWENGYDKYVTKDKMWIFGKNREDWPDFLKRHGWRIVEDIGADYFLEKYGRPTGREFASTEVERTILAEKV